MMTFLIDGKTHVPNHQPDNKGFLQLVAFIQVWNLNWFVSTVRTRKTHRLIRLDIRYMCQQWITMEIWLKDVERNLFIPVFNRKSYTPGVGLFNLRLGLKGPRTDSPKFFWLVVYLPLWKIWKSVGSNYCSQHMEKNPNHQPVFIIVFYFHYNKLLQVSFNFPDQQQFVRWSKMLGNSIPSRRMA